MRVSRDEWPIVTLFPRPGGPLEAWREGWAKVEHIVEGTTGAFGLLADARVSQPPSALERRVVTLFFERQERILSTRCVGLAVAVSNPMVRAAATAVFWVASPPMPVSLEADAATARSWLDTRLRDVGAA
ncbi:MAG: hypothetical protein H6719_33400 [Sandaracinaceae bacterium]|nr:hypothetical protein [Sandaracinaceae bacterium]